MFNKNFKKIFIVACKQVNRKNSWSFQCRTLKNTINHLLVKQSETTTYQPKALEKPNIVDIESVITKHHKTSHGLRPIWLKK